MALMKVVQYPDPVLTTRTEEVEEIGARERVLVHDMIETMHHENGVGLAANQVGVNKRIFVASADGVRGKEQVYFNPKIVSKSGKLKEFEGCLSVREVYEPCTRYRQVTLEALNLNGEKVRIGAKGLLARIFQHEVDHLDGFVFVHRLGLFKRKKLFKRLDARA